MDIVEFVEKVLDTLRDMDNGIDVICNLDAKAVVERMKVVDIIPIPEGATNGDVIKAMFPNKQFVSICSDRIYDFTTDNKIDCDLEWWNAPYKREAEE